MRMAMGILAMTFGASFIYVASHQITTAAPGFHGIWQEVLNGIDGSTPTGD